MRFLFLTFLAALVSAPASAHVGHLGELAGHDHWVLGAGIGAIVGAAVLGWLKGGKEEEKDEEAAEEEQGA